jgi:hypothetical protein
VDRLRVLAYVSVVLWPLVLAIVIAVFSVSWPVKTWFSLMRSVGLPKGAIEFCPHGYPREYAPKECQECKQLPIEAWEE